MFGAVKAAVTGWARFPLLLWLCTRAGLMLFSEMILTLAPKPYRNPPWHEVFLRPYPWIDGLCRWDCGWYLKIASNGYRDPMSAAFWPLYPLLTRIFGELTHANLIIALICVANLATLGAWLAMYRFFTRLEGEEVARWSLGLFAAYPFAFFQAEAYPESMMVFFSITAVSLAMANKPIRAGVSLGFAALTRHMGMLAGIALLIAQLRERGIKRLLVERGVLGLIVPWLIVAAYPLWLWHYSGDPLAFVHVRTQGWVQAWMSIVQPFLDHSTDARYWIYPLISLIPAAGVVMLALEKRWELAALGALYLVTIWSIGAESLGRYTASCWPAFLALGLLVTRRPRWQIPIMLGFALFQGLFFALFVQNYQIV